MSIKEEGKCDHTGEFTIFGQLFQYCQRPGTDYRNSLKMNSTDD